MTATVLALRPRAETLVERHTDTLARLEQAGALLQQVQTIQDVKQIHDVVKALRVYAREHRLGIEVQARARIINFEALRRLGELLHTTVRNTGTRGQLIGRGLIGPSNTEGPIEAPPTLAELGIDYVTSSLAQRLFLLPLDVFYQIRNGRTTLARVEAQVITRARRDADTQAHIDLINKRGGPDAADLRVCSCAELFASGIKPDAVITEPPRGAELSELARACVDVPLVAVRTSDPSYLYLPETLDCLREHLTWRGGNSRYGNLVLVFGQKDALEHAKTRPVPGPTPLRPCLAWDEFFVQYLTDPGGLVCDPFLCAETTIAALEFGRRFVGCSPDAEVVADTRRRIGAVR